MSANLNAKVLEYAQVTGRALHIANDLLSKQAAKTAAAESRIPQLVELLSTAGLIDDHEKQAAATQLHNVDDSLAIMENVIQHYRQKLADAKTAGLNLGRGIPQPGEAKPTSNPNYLGRRRGVEEKTASDHALLRLVPGYTAR